MKNFIATVAFVFAATTVFAGEGPAKVQAPATVAKAAPKSECSNCTTATVYQPLTRREKVRLNLVKPVEVKTVEVKAVEVKKVEPVKAAAPCDCCNGSCNAVAGRTGLLGRLRR
jgi:hypothetical protein